MSLAVTPAGSSPSTVTAMALRARLGQRLGGEDVLDLAGADAEGQRAEGAVGRGVAVAADDGHARLGEALLGADDVDDALAGRRPSGSSVMPNSAALARSTSTCLARDRIGDGLVDVRGRDVVVLGGDGQVGPAHAAAGQAQAVEGLGRGDLVDEVEVDVEQVGLAGAVAGVHHVAVPDLLGQGAGGIRRCSRSSREMR